MTKEFILAEIVRTANANGGKPLGRTRFEKETGIRQNDWYGKHWTAWGAAITEAGFSPNDLQRAYDSDFLVQKVIELMRELHPVRFPVEGDFLMKSRRTPGFPSHTVFHKLGNKHIRAVKVMEYCTRIGGLDDIVALCKTVPAPESVEEASTEEDTDFGFVYLLRSGRNYKIGSTNSTGRRTRELAIQLPERTTLEHEIRTDDPAGIEAYWHHRFRAKRKNGEWFALDQSDLKAFRRRKFM